MNDKKEICFSFFFSAKWDKMRILKKNYPPKNNFPIALRN